MVGTATVAVGTESATAEHFHPVAAVEASSQTVVAADQTAATALELQYN